MKPCPRVISVQKTLTTCWIVQQKVVRLNDYAEVDQVCRTVLCDMTNEVFLRLIEVMRHPPLLQLHVFTRSERPHPLIPPLRTFQLMTDIAVRQRRASGLAFILTPS